MSGFVLITFGHFAGGSLNPAERERINGWEDLQRGNLYPRVSVGSG